MGLTQEAAHSHIVSAVSEALYKHDNPEEDVPQLDTIDEQVYKARAEAAVDAVLATGFVRLTEEE